MTMKLPQFFLSLLFAVSLKLASTRDAVERRGGVCSWTTYEGSGCPRSDFPCAEGSCIRRELFCDGRRDCPDGSDEEFCELHFTYGCRAYLDNKMTECPSENGKCILKEWVCDGVRDCSDGSDEFCDKVDNDEHAVKTKALNWLKKQKRSLTSAMDAWGPSVDKLAVAFHLSSNEGDEVTRKEMAYELSIQLLSRLILTKLGDIPPYDLASYVNAFLVTCLDPRKFHGQDIVQELRTRVDRQNYTNPYLLLALCNAGDDITELDKMKLLDAFWTARRSFWTDTRALAVMALACSDKQNESDSEGENMHRLLSTLKQHQPTNGSSGLQTLGLVMQALLSAEPDSDNSHFDEAKALKHIKTMQMADGSFGSLLNTYYVLPVLNCKSLADISSKHCPEHTKQAIPTLDELMGRSVRVPKIRVRYSVWIGSDSDLERNLVLRVPAYFSFFRVMEIAADADSRYRFEYVMQEGKPYINAVSGLQDDPEKGKFWSLYTVEEGKPPLISPEESPADVVPNDNVHFVMWYRSGTWVE